MQSNTFEIEIWQDSNKIKKILISIALITAVAWIMCLIGKFYWNDYVTTEVTFRGKIKYVGWPAKAYYYGMYIGIAGVLSFIIVKLTQDTKHPCLALNKEGVYINQQMIKETLVKWDNINALEFKEEASLRSMAIYFNDPDKIIALQSSAKRAFLKENLKDNKPLVCNNKFTIGDLKLFYEEAKKKLNH
ncbi:hypothetical protein [Flavobacterium sp. TBRC 19031]|uniref:hypothetical protein n=1 Tax=Flavobacterium mekongense TaxID=3379707 RepID=UPI00399A4D9E